MMMEIALAALRQVSSILLCWCRGSRGCYSTNNHNLLFLGGVRCLLVLLYVPKFSFVVIHFGLFGDMGCYMWTDSMVIESLSQAFGAIECNKV